MARIEVVASDRSSVTREQGVGKEMFHVQITSKFYPALTYPGSRWHVVVYGPCGHLWPAVD